MDYLKELEKVKNRYQSEGYSVTINPTADQLPPFAKDFTVDLIAIRGDESAIVQVKENRAALEADVMAPVQAGIANSHQGWRYDLILLDEGDPVQRLTRGAREPSEQEIDQTLQHVERMIDKGDLQAAYVFGWAAVEAAMRRVANDVELYMPKKSPSELLNTLYGNGVLTRLQYDQLKRSFRVRTEIVHGMVPPEIDPLLVRSVVSVARYLLKDPSEVQSAATPADCL